MLVHSWFLEIPLSPNHEDPCVHACVFVYVFVCVCMCVCAYVCVRTCMCAYMHVCVHLSVRACVWPSTREAISNYSHEIRPGF